MTTHQASKKITSKRVGEAGTQTHHKPHPWQAPNWKRTQNLELLDEA